MDFIFNIVFVATVVNSWEILYVEDVLNYGSINRSLQLDVLRTNNYLLSEWAIALLLNERDGGWKGW